MRQTPKLLIAMLFLFLSTYSWGQNCNSTRYIDDLFSVTTTIEPAIFATVDNFPFEFTTEPLDLTFNLFEPTGDVLEKRPLIIMAFGGAFLAGSKTQAELVDYCEAMARKGFVVAAIDYRLGFDLFDNESVIRAVYRGAQDFRAAVRYFRQNAALYKIDPDHVFGGGNSAGAISAIHATFLTDADRTPSSLLGSTFFQNYSPSWPDLGCMDCSGNNFTTSGIPNLVVSLWGAIGDLDWVTPGDVPIISFHGDDDGIVDINCGPPFSLPFFPNLCGSIPLHDEATIDGNLNELHVFPGGGHELWNNTADATFIKTESADFMYQYMRSSTSAPVVQGSDQGCQEVTSSFSIQNPDPNSIYCWTVSNDGTIVTDNNNSIVVQWTGDGVSSTVSVNEQNCLDIASDVTDFVVNVECLPLPVELLAFNVKRHEENAASLNWISAIEDNLEFYDIEYSLDGRNFESIGMVDAKNIESEFYNYNFIHKDLASGKHYYRLNMVDFDGSEKRSETVMVEIESIAIAIYPNPTSDFINITLPDNFRATSIIQLANSQGQIVEQLNTGIGTIRIPVSHLSPGFYVLNIENGERNMVEKILIK